MRQIRVWDVKSWKKHLKEVFQKPGGYKGTQIHLLSGRNNIKARPMEEIQPAHHRWSQLEDAFNIPRWRASTQGWKFWIKTELKKEKKEKGYK